MAIRLVTVSPVPFAGFLWLILRPELMVLFGGLFLGTNLTRVLGLGRDMRKQFGDSAHSFSTTLSEYHAQVWLHVLWVFDETEPAKCLVSRSEVFLRHGGDSSCLPHTAHMN